MTGLVLDDSGFEVVDGAERIGTRRVLGASDQALLRELGVRYVRAVQSGAGDEILVRLGRELWSWVEGDQGQLTALLERAAAPVVFEVRGPRSPSDPAWAVLRAPFELLARPDGGFLAADALLRFGVTRRLGPPGAPPPADGFRLGLAFMASSPRRQHELDFEAEEAAILQAVDDGRVDLIVEDTGNPVELGRRLADVGGMPAVHLSCHGVNAFPVRPGRPGEPVLMMEDEVGDDLPTTAADLVRLMPTPPRLLFVSACLTATSAGATGHLPAGADRRAGPTGDAPEGILVHSMATALISAGVPAVLGWDGSVRDDAATVFAEELYQRLSNRADLAVAVGDARRRLLTAAEPAVRADWHLARLWLGPPGGGPLVGGTRRRSRVSAVQGTKVFLDRKHHVPVAAPEMFVGRRAELQRALRALRSADRAGVLLHGQGRLGKSSLAARVADRCPQLIPAIVFGDYSAAAVLDVIAEAVQANPAARELIERRRPEVRDRPEAIEPLLIDLLSGPLSQAGDGQRALLLIIDDLEQILLADPAGPHRVDPRAAPVLRAVLRAFDPDATDSRVLLTSRFRFTLDRLEERLEQIPLRPLSTVARHKLLARQQAQVSPARRAERQALAERAVEVSRGNPGLQDLIGLRLVFSDEVELSHAEAAVAGMESYLQQGALPAEGQVRDFLERLALDTLLDEAGPEHRALLRDLTLFGTPVPESVVAVLATQSGGSPERLVGLGLVDVFPDAVDPRQTALAPNALAAGRLDPLDADEVAALSAVVVEPLFAAWGGVAGADRRAGELDLLLTQLALVVGNTEVTAVCAVGAVQALRAGPAVNALRLGQAAIALLDAQRVRAPFLLLRRVADAAATSGHGDTAGSLFDRVSREVQADGAQPATTYERASVLAEHGDYLVNCGDLDRAEELLRQAHGLFIAAGSAEEATSCLVVLADIRHQRADYDEALRIYTEEALPVFERLGETRQVALIWQRIAAVHHLRGNYDEALRITLEETMPVYERLGDTARIADAWGLIADVHYRRGNYDEALRIRHDVELPVYERLGDVREGAIVWGKIADIHYRRGDLGETLRIRRDVELPVYERLGDVRSIAVTWGQIADVYYDRGDLDEVLRIRKEVELPAYERLGEARESAVAWGKIADIHFQRGELDEALRIHSEQTLPVFDRLGEARLAATTRGRIGTIHFQRGNVDLAAELQNEVLRVAETMGNPEGTASAQWALAQIEITRRDYQAAFDLLLSSFQTFRRLGNAEGTAVVGEVLAQILIASKNFDDAKFVLEVSRTAAERIGNTAIIDLLDQASAEVARQA